VTSRIDSSIAIVRATIICERAAKNARCMRARRPCGALSARKRSTSARASSGSNEIATGSLNLTAPVRPSAAAGAMHTITAVRLA
jgi:hypothetical protein